MVSMTNLNPTASHSCTKGYKMTSSVTSRDSPKKIKIYVDEDLDLEAGLITGKSTGKTRKPDHGSRDR